jgi:hypothetical protein
MRFYMAVVIVNKSIRSAVFAAVDRLHTFSLENFPAAVERFLHTQEVARSNPASRRISLLFAEAGAYCTLKTSTRAIPVVFPAPVTMAVKAPAGKEARMADSRSSVGAKPVA